MVDGRKEESSGHLHSDPSAVAVQGALSVRALSPRAVPTGHTGGALLHVGNVIYQLWPLGFSDGSGCKESACSAGVWSSIPVVRKIPRGREWQLTTVFLPGEFHRQRSLVGYSPQGHKESDMTKHLMFSIMAKVDQANQPRQSSASHFIKKKIVSERGK